MIKKIDKLKLWIFIVLALVVLGLAILLTWAKLTEKPPAVKVVQAEPPKETELSILCVGDIMVHNSQMEAQYDSAKSEYSFDNNFSSVKKYIKAADLALCNVETTFAEKPYSGYPDFNAPDALAGALKNTGFDVGITSNNHMMDKGINGMLRTIDVLKDNGLSTAGSVKKKNGARYLLKTVKGIKVGIIAYTYESDSGQDPATINGHLVSDEVAAHINSFNFNTLDEDLPKIKESINGAKDAGAQVIVVYYHWGKEYQRSANEMQKKLAQKTADMGADVIFASHPHVLQKAVYLKAKKTQKRVPVFYSMGNFLSNQRSETLGNRYTEQGLMAQVNFKYSEDGGIRDIKMGGVPTWVDKYYSEGKQVYEIVPLDDGIEQNEAIAVSGHLSRAQQAQEDANGILGIDKQQN